jgi:hypothetical protein
MHGLARLINRGWRIRAEVPNFSIDTALASGNKTSPDEVKSPNSAGNFSGRIKIGPNGRIDRHNRADMAANKKQPGPVLAGTKRRGTGC